MVHKRFWFRTKWNGIKVWVRKSVCSSAFWIAIFTGVLSLSTIELCSISKTNKDILIANQRAYVSLKTINAANATDSKSQKLTGMQFFVEFENSGTTPTKGVYVKLDEGTSLPKKFDFGDLAKPEKGSSWTIAPKATRTARPLVVDIDTLNNIMQKKSRLFFWGGVIYRDIFKGTPTRLTEFCTELNVERIYGNPDKTMLFIFTPCPERNCFDEDCADYQTLIQWVQ